MGRARGVDCFEVVVGGEALMVTSMPVEPRDGLGTLTAIERAVARDAIAGLSNAAIAKKRRRAVRTIANQLASVYRKLGVGSRAELAAHLIR
jgi:DNA-binding NarL/FixJ family response regulator